MSELSYGREPVVIVELFQPRCGLRFGVAPCAATGGPKCYQTWGSCRDRASIDLSGSITWRFRRPGAGILPMYAEAGEHILTNPIPLLVSVSTTSSAINTGAQRDGQAPLGIRASCTVTLKDGPWDDHVGDFYLTDRAGVQGNFWAKWRARNAFYSGFMLRIYEGYAGQALVDMQRRDYVLESVDGPDASGRVVLMGKDPLRLADVRQAQFPRATDIRLVGDIDAATTAIRVNGFVADLDADFGNTGTRRFLRIGQEIVLYTGRTLVSGSVYDLTGVQRGVLDTVAAAARSDAVCQRVGRYERMRPWEIAGDLIDNHTPIPAGYRDAAAWADEGLDHLVTQIATRTVAAPEPVDRLLGELCQQGNFAIWWDERRRTIPMLANRPPSGDPVVISDRLNVLKGTAQTRDDPEAQISRVAIYYNPRGPFDLDKAETYRTLRLTIDGEIEAAAGAVRTLTVYAKWITRDTDAVRFAARLLLRYRLPTRYLALELDAKDRAIRIGDVLDVTTGAFVDVEGQALATRWQVVRAEEHRPGDAVRLELQSYFFLGRFGVIMPADATPDYVDATDAEKAVGCYLADAATGLMPNGDPPYLLQ